MQTTRGASLSDGGEARGTEQSEMSAAIRERSDDVADNRHGGDGTSVIDASEAGLDGPRRRRHIGVLAGVALVVLAIDVISKVLVVANLSDHEIKLLGGFLKLEETRNAGAAFSIGTGATFIFALVAIGVIAVIARTARRLYSRPWAIVLGLLLGGAMGNLIDRLVRSPGVFRGWVVDWIRLPHFAVFNLADSAITIGAVLAVLLALSGRQIDGSHIALRGERLGAARRPDDDPGTSRPSADTDEQ